MLAKLLVNILDKSLVRILAKWLVGMLDKSLMNICDALQDLVPFIQF